MEMEVGGGGGTNIFAHKLSMQSNCTLSEVTLSEVQEMPLNLITEF